MMEFWGVEVKPGMTVSCVVRNDYVIHVSQAALGETKKGSETAVVSVKIDNKKIVIGTLSVEKYPQILCDLIFEKAFELSNSSKTTSVFFCGYKTFLPGSDSGEDEDEEETENIPVTNPTIGKSEAKALAKALPKDGKKDKQDDDDSDEDESDDSDYDLDLSDDDVDEMSEDVSSDEGDDSSDSDEEDESDAEEDEETPKKAETSKKRATEIALKTPVSDKKAKIATPSGQKTGDKMGVHVATPHPAKQASKTPANSKAKEKSRKEKSPKSATNTHACKSCSKTFGSDAALQSHLTAKHSAELAK